MLLFSTLLYYWHSFSLFEEQLFMEKLGKVLFYDIGVQLSFSEELAIQ